MEKRDLVQASTAINTDVNIDQELLALRVWFVQTWLSVPIAVAQDKEPIVQNGELAGDVEVAIDRALESSGIQCKTSSAHLPSQPHLLRNQLHPSSSISSSSSSSRHFKLEPGLILLFCHCYSRFLYN